MGHYDFSRMGWQQFEQMVQSLAFAELGNGLTIFGGGRDGQREATWKGRVNFPVGQASWNGPGVLQAKYKERQTSESESSWFISQIDSELKGWAKKRSASRSTTIPAYFLFASNVSLSAVETIGGKDRFEVLITKYRQALGIKGAVAWDYNQLRTLLDKHADIRRTYLEQITTGDFLTDLDSRLPKRVAITAEHLAINAAFELVRKQYTKVSDVGFSGNGRFKLADIGIDLPGQVDTKSDNFSLSLTEVSVARYVTELGDRVYRPQQGGDDAGGVLLIGGPGQGKSTIAQLIAHLYRVAFLKDAGIVSFGEVADIALEDLKRRFATAGFRSPDRRRWPFVIDLAAYNQKKSGEERPNLMGYIADNVRVEGASLKADQLLDWLASWPCALILDGLDEVPNSTDRERLVASIHEFVLQARHRNVDLFAIVTTRPQGYRQEMEDALPLQTIIMRELNDTEALNYADSLMQIREPNDEEERSRVANRLLEAVADKAAGKLMGTPLQVSILTALAERAVTLPQTRHELFDAYYEVIYDRERAKAEESRLLTLHRPHIDYLHEQAGLSLEVFSEKWRNSDAAIPRNSLETILRTRLSASGFDKYQVSDISRSIMRTTTDRLVLLVAKSADDRFSFEVRSLQEYMAARAITAGSDDQVRQAMLMLHSSAHWRNTYLLAVGRLLKERSALGKLVIEDLSKIDSSSAENQVVMSGAEAAADLFLDAVAAAYPTLRRLLLDTALELLGGTADALSRRIRLIIRELESPEADAGEVSILKNQLIGKSQANRSSVAALFLASLDKRQQVWPDLKKVLLRERFAYEQPTLRSVEDRQFALAIRLKGMIQSGDDSGAEVHKVIQMFEYVEEQEKRALLDSDQLIKLGPEKTPAPEAFSLEAPSVRQALVAVHDKYALIEPDIAEHAASMLRSLALRRELGNSLRKLYPVQGW
jgi:hypothetical protein